MVVVMVVVHLLSSVAVVQYEVYDQEKNCTFFNDYIPTYHPLCCHLKQEKNEIL